MINSYFQNFICQLTCHSYSPRRDIQRCCRTKIVDEQWLDIGRSHKPNYAGTFYWKLLIVFFWNQHTHYNKFLPNLVCTTTYFWCYCREKSGVIIDRCCFFVYFVAISTEIAISIDFIWRYEAFIGRTWALVVVSVAVFGACVSLWMLVYVFIKMCDGTLAGSNQTMGVLLLVGVTCLFARYILFLY